MHIFFKKIYMYALLFIFKNEMNIYHCYFVEQACVTNVKRFVTSSMGSICGVHVKKKSLVNSYRILKKKQIIS